MMMGYFGNCFSLNLVLLYTSPNKRILGMCGKLLERETTSRYIVHLLMSAFVWDAIFHFARVQSLDGLSEFDGTGAGNTLLTISNQDSRRVSLSSAFQVEL
jgi:hypothetical protein